jgi:hypothetical protein
MKITRWLGGGVALLLVFAGCSKPAGTQDESAALNQQILGEWVPPEQDGETMVFSAGGGWSARPPGGGPKSAGRWVIQDKKLTLTWVVIKGKQVPTEEPPWVFDVISVEPKLMRLQRSGQDVGEWRRVK